MPNQTPKNWTREGLGTGMFVVQRHQRNGLLAHVPSDTLSFSRIVDIDSKVNFSVDYRIRGVAHLRRNDYKGGTLEILGVSEITYQQCIKIARGVRDFKWIPNRVVTSSDLRNEIATSRLRCKQPCRRSCIDPGCVCINGKCR